MNEKQKEKASAKGKQPEQGSPHQTPKMSGLGRTMQQILGQQQKS